MKPLLPTAGARISVLLVDDNAAISEGLRILLRGETDIDVVENASFGPDMVKKVALVCPDVVVLMPDQSGRVQVELIREILRLGPPVQLVVVSVNMVLEELSRLLQAGAKGYILTESVSGEIVGAIRAVRAGRRYLSPTVSNALVDDYVKKSVSSMYPKDPLFLLNMREKEILQLVVEGKGSATIADTLNLSVSTVNTYRCKVMKKLGLRDLTELVRFAIRNGLTPLSSSQAIRGAVLK